MCSFEIDRITVEDDDSFSVAATTKLDLTSVISVAAAVAVVECEAFGKGT